MAKRNTTVSENTTSEKKTKAPKVPAPKAAKAPAPKAAKAPVVRAEGDSKVTIDRSRYTYTQHDAKTNSGRKVVDNADMVADLLRGLTLDEVRGVIDENGITWKWDHLNPGMQRMNAGNALRGHLRKNGKVKVRGKNHNAPVAEAA